MLVSLEDQLTFVLVASVGSISWISVPVVPSSKLSSAGSIVIPVTDIAARVTVIVDVAVKPPSSVLTVTVAVPSATAVTTPF